MNETWKPVAGWPAYEVSDIGNVNGRRGPLSTFLVKDYQAFNVCCGNRRASLRVHREVLRAFLGDQPTLCARHLNDDHHDNKLVNLAWGTWKENEHDKSVNGHSLAGTRHHQAKLTEEQVREIKVSQTRGTVLARHFGVTPSCVCSIRRGRSWRTIA